MVSQRSEQFFFRLNFYFDAIIEFQKTYIKSSLVKNAKLRLVFDRLWVHDEENAYFFVHTYSFYFSIESNLNVSDAQDLKGKICWELSVAIWIYSCDLYLLIHSLDQSLIRKIWVIC